MQIQAYLHFAGNCEEALNFYSQALGGKIEMLMRYQDNPEPPPPGTLAPGMKNKVMHANLLVGDGNIMASDDCSGTQTSFQGFQLSLSAANETEAKRCFSNLAEGGLVKMPLGKTFFSPCFGMLTDRFGVSWMVIVFTPQ